MVGLKRTNQGGAIVTFVVVAVVLALVVIGTAYFVKQRGEQVRRDQAVAQADKLAKSTDTSPAPVATPKPTTSAQPTTTPTPVKPATTPSVAVPAPAATAKPTPAPVASAQPALPTTGPESVMINVLALGLLVASATAYATSPRTPSRSL